MFRGHRVRIAEGKDGMMQALTVRRTFAALVGLVLVLGACSSSGGGSALSKDEFLKKGNAICDAGNKAIDAAGKTAFPSSDTQPDAASIKKFANEVLIPNVTKQVDDIDALKPPKDLEAAVDKLVKDAKAAITKMKDLADKDPEAIFSGSNDPFADVNKEANAIGLTTCGADSNSSSASSS
jgi:hypothetical protein